MIELLNFFEAHFILSLIIIVIVMLATGSFLNVVIYRLPLMMIKDWHQQCEDLHKEYPKPAEQDLNLAFPASHCPKCQEKLKAWENMPILSYLFLRGRCAHCKEKISLQYPLVESLCVILSVLSVLYFGLSWQGLCAVIFSCILIILSFIDINKLLLPDSLTMSLLWLGLVANFFNIFCSLEDAVLGVILGYVPLWLFARVYALVRGQEGFGGGDFKLLAAMGACLGWQLLPFIILVSCLAGIIIHVSLSFVGRHAYSKPLPFGPYIAIAGWIAMLFGNTMTDAYLGLYL